MEADGQEVLHGPRLADRPAERTGSGRSGRRPGTPPAAEAAQPHTPEFRGGYTAVGYLAAVEWRYVADAGFETLGRGVVWARPADPADPGRGDVPMCRALLIADSGSGVSATLDARRFLFINVDLAVVLTRDPVGEWVLLDAATTIGEQGTGLAETKISDIRGPCGSATQIAAGRATLSRRRGAKDQRGGPAGRTSAEDQRGGPARRTSAEGPQREGTVTVALTDMP